MGVGDWATGVWVDAAGGSGSAIVCAVLRFGMGVMAPGLENGFDLSESFCGIERGGAESDGTLTESGPESWESDGGDVSGREIESVGLRSAWRRCSSYIAL